jgi:HNH endonuclease
MPTSTGCCCEAEETAPGQASAVKRSRLRRGPWRRKKNRDPRPGLTEVPRAGKAWRLVCAAIVARDVACRRCGQVEAASRFHVDHLIPRRLCASPEDADRPDNLAALCGGCHSIKTQQIEPALYRGDVLAFEQFLRVIGRPHPPNDLIAGAYARLRVLKFGG